MTVSSLDELIKTQAIEYILAMMAWKFKQNYLKNPSEKNKRLISELSEIDVNSKTGKSDLVSAITLLLVREAYP